jgi:hypothetical protein
MPANRYFDPSRPLRFINFAIRKSAARFSTIPGLTAAFTLSVTLILVIKV